jgi:hypothetical protein
VNRDRTFAFATFAVGIAAVALLLVGREGWQRQLAWGLWPLLILLPILAGQLRRRDLRRR